MDREREKRCFSINNNVLDDYTICGLFAAFSQAKEFFALFVATFKRSIQKFHLKIILKRFVNFLKRNSHTLFPQVLFFILFFISVFCLFLHGAAQLIYISICT